MKLGDTTLRASITEDEPTKKVDESEYLFSDANSRYESGLGIRRLLVEGVARGIAEKRAVESECLLETVRKLSWTDLDGEFYYWVQTDPAVFSRQDLTTWHYAFNASACDPNRYDLETDGAVS